MDAGSDLLGLYKRFVVVVVAVRGWYTKMGGYTLNGAEAHFALTRCLSQRK